MLDEWKFVIDFLSTSDFLLISSLFFLRFQGFHKMNVYFAYTIDGWYFDVSFALKQIHFLLTELYDRSMRKGGQSY